MNNIKLCHCVEHVNESDEAKLFCYMKGTGEIEAVKAMTDAWADAYIKWLTFITDNNLIGTDARNLDGTNLVMFNSHMMGLAILYKKFKDKGYANSLHDMYPKKSKNPLFLQLNQILKDFKKIIAEAAS